LGAPCSVELKDYWCDACAGANCVCLPLCERWNSSQDRWI